MTATAADLGRRRVLRAGLASTALFLPTPYAWVWAQSDGALKLLRVPKLALVVGNGRYAHAPLRTPLNDGRAMAAALKNTGFAVTTLLDTNKADLSAAVERFAAALAQARGVGLFYFAGHGVQLAWRNYVVPIDAVMSSATDIPKQCIDVSALLGGIAKAKNLLNVIILDACRDNPFSSLAGIDQKGLSQIDAPPGTLLAYATAPGNVASDGDGDADNGLYTEYLLKEIIVPEAKIEDVFKRVRLQVRRRSNGRQIPWESTSLEEDFYFVPPQALSERAAEDTERERQQELAARAKRQAAEEAERKRREAMAAVERQRITDEAERNRQHELAAREAKLAAEEEAARARSRQAPQSDPKERQFEAELALWEQIKASTEATPLESYLLRYPSGRFSELAQLKLDAILAKQGELKVTAVSAPANPFSKGTARADTDHRVGDRYEYRELDVLTRVEQRRVTYVVRVLTDDEVIYGAGGTVTDRLGNYKLWGRTIWSTNQLVPLEYAVGKRWQTRFSFTTAAGHFSTVDLDVKVAERENITLDVGTFNAFRVEARGWRIGENLNIQWHWKMWFAPDDLRRVIAWEWFNRNARGGFSNTTRAELTSFQEGRRRKKAAASA